MSQSFKSSPATLESCTPNLESLYVIFRRPDLTLQFHPPIGSRELANALSFKYPNGDLTAKLRQASTDFITEEFYPTPALEANNVNRTSGDGLQSNDKVATKLPNSVHETTGSSNAIFSTTQEACEPLTKLDSGPPIAIWDASTMQQIHDKRRRRPYDSSERHKVAENRRQRAVCDGHRLKKTKCDPQLCPGNKLYKKQQEMNDLESKRETLRPSYLLQDCHEKSSISDSLDFKFSTNSLPCGASLDASHLDTLSSPKNRSAGASDCLDQLPIPLHDDLSDINTADPRNLQGLAEPRPGIESTTDLTLEDFFDFSFTDACSNNQQIPEQGSYH